MLDQQAAFTKKYKQHYEHMRGAAAFHSSAVSEGGVYTCMRYESHLQRVYDRALRQYRLLQKHSRQDAENK